MRTSLTTSVQPQVRTIDGLQIRYADSGGDRDQVVLLTSPWLESVYAFAPMWATLAEHARLFAVDLPGFGASERRDDLMSPVRFHRILRRGREYGPELLPENALTPAPPDEPERGLHFICLNANIARQFEFLQNAWMINTKFSALSEESDPLVGNREKIIGCPATSVFTQPGDGALGRRVSDLPQFVTVRGGAYFFLPSLRALRYFAGRSEA